ncbi:hypothetical protein P4C99_15535 [Pontiellaceae bacterium B1224]|nr:hypothetical protein [Pontiellaceae bacterium B1224]
MKENDDQLGFDFSADSLLEFPLNREEKGWSVFESDQKQAIQRLEERFGIALNRRVQLRLNGWPQEFNGKLMLEGLLLPTGHEKTVRLRLGKLTFDNTDIEYCRTLD